MSDASNTYEARYQKRLDTVEAETRRFLGKLLDYRAAITGDGTTPKEAGAMKRASLDLTRALANLRKPYYQ